MLSSGDRHSGGAGEGKFLSYETKAPRVPLLLLFLCLKMKHFVSRNLTQQLWKLERRIIMIQAHVKLSSRGSFWKDPVFLHYVGKVSLQKGPGPSGSGPSES